MNSMSSIIIIDKYHLEIFLENLFDHQIIPQQANKTKAVIKKIQQMEQFYSLKLTPTVLYIQAQNKTEVSLTSHNTCCVQMYNMIYMPVCC